MVDVQADAEEVIIHEVYNTFSAYPLDRKAVFQSSNPELD